MEVHEYMEKLNDEGHRWFAFEADPHDVAKDYMIDRDGSYRAVQKQRVVEEILKWRHDWYQDRLWEKKHDKNRVFVETGGNTHGRIGYWMDDPTMEPQVLPW